MILSFLVSVALAAGHVVAVLPASGAPDDRRVQDALTDAGFSDVTLVGGAAFVDGFDIVTVNARQNDEDCGGPVALDGWRRRLEVARGRFQMLAFEQAVGELLALELEAACLESAPSASDLFGVELALAEAHGFLAQGAPDAAGRGFHQQEVAAALDRAAAFGVDLSTPPDVDPDVLVGLDAARERLRAQVRPRVVVAGPGARVGARFNGRPLPGGPFDAVAGPNLVQGATGASITAAASLPLRARSRTLVWLAPGDAPKAAGEALLELASLSRGGADGKTPLLGAAAQLADGEVVYIGGDSNHVTLWRPVGDHLRKIGPAEEPALVKTPTAKVWQGIFGVGLDGGWSSVGGGELEGLGGPNAGFALYGRYAVAPRWAVAVTLNPTANWRPLAGAEGEGTLFRATVPARVGARWGSHEQGWQGEVGLDVGAHFFGTFTEERVGFMACATGAIGHDLGERGGVRAEMWGGTGLGYAVLGASVSLEARQ